MVTDGATVMEPEAPTYPTLLIYIEVAPEDDHERDALSPLVILAGLTFTVHDGGGSSDHVICT